ncbi:MAG: hypothetical protein HYY23_13495 [Verrucomicrobia bacterium]|nr:hypothetical protein [Verrucomicrobiota bacterium]
MLAIISDLHLCDATASDNVNPDAFEKILLPTLIGHAKPRGAEEIRLVLLGDIYDLVRTSQWFKDKATGAAVPPAERPWNGQIDPATGMNRNLKKIEARFRRILKNTLDTAPHLPQIAKEAARTTGLPTTVHYVIGNHDRALHNFPSLQKMIQDAFAPVAVEFSRSVHWLEYGTHARHGHEWDENCVATLLLREVLQRDQRWDALDSEIGPHIDRVMGIGEVVTAELMAGLTFHLAEAGREDLARDIRDVNDLRPIIDVFLWLEWMFRKFGKPEKDALTHALIQSITGVVDSEFGKLWDQVQADWLVSGDLVDRLQLARAQLEDGGYDRLRDFAEKVVPIADFFTPDRDPLFEGARKEFETRLGPEIQYLFYGHTHEARHDFFSNPASRTARLYVNTGTFQPLIQRTVDGKSFCKAQRMSMAFVYRKDEVPKGSSRNGPALDLWNGIKRAD